MADSPAPSLDNPRGQRAWEWLWPTLSGAQREGVELILQPSKREEAGDAVGAGGATGAERPAEAAGARAAPPRVLNVGGWARPAGGVRGGAES